MSAKELRPHLQRRNKDLMAMYKKLSSQTTPKGKALFRHSALIEQLADHFYLSESYVERLLKTL